MGCCGEVHIVGNFCPLTKRKPKELDCEKNMQKICGIYKITSPTGKIYIGQSIDIKRRWQKDYKYLRNSRSPKLYNSFKKHGVENHKFEIIEECLQQELNYKEKHYVDLFQTFNSNHGLNLRDGGGNKGAISDETKKKQSIAHKSISDETRTKMRLAKLKKPSKYWLGKNRSEETKEILRQKSLGNQNSKGFKHSEETKIRHSERMLGSKMSDNTKQKMKMSENRGKYIVGHSPSNETRQKQSISRLGKKPSPETINKMKLRKGDKNGFYGKHHTEEAKLKMRLSKLK